MGWQRHSDAHSFHKQHAIPGIVLAATMMFEGVAAPACAAAGAMTEDELRHASAQGWPDNLFKRSVFASNGNVVELFGERGRYLNPLASLLDADTRFQDVAYNRVDPSIVTDRNGTTMIRLWTTVGAIDVRQIHVRGSGGTSFGNVTIRSVDLRGTVIKVSTH